MNGGMNVTSKTKITQDPERTALLSQVRPFESSPAIGESDGRTSSSKALVAQDGHPLREADSQGSQCSVLPWAPTAKGQPPPPPYLTILQLRVHVSVSPPSDAGPGSTPPFWARTCLPSFDTNSLFLNKGERRDLRLEEPR